MGKHSTSNRLAVDQPTRGADRNRSLADQADPATDEMLLPSLGDGITLLDVEGGRGVPILQSLVLDHLLLHDGPAFWVDANGHATTTTLAQIAPSQRLLNRIHVARGFTAYQHYGAVCDLPTAVNKSIQMSTTDAETAGRGEPSRDEDMSPHTPALIVAPAVDAQYRAAWRFRVSGKGWKVCRTGLRQRISAIVRPFPRTFPERKADSIVGLTNRQGDHSSIVG